MRLIKLMFFFTLSLLWIFASYSTGLRIVSLAPSISDQIILLAGEDSLVGVTSYCPSSLQRKKEVIGTPLLVSLEKVVSLKPDLILAAPINPEREIEKLRRLNFKIIVFPKEDSYQTVKRNFLRLAQLLGREERAKEILKRVEEELAEIAQQTPVERKKVLIQLGRNPLVIAGANTYLNQMLEFAGAYNLGAEIGRGFLQVNREKILELNPEVIFMVLHGEELKKGKDNWSEFQVIQAVRNNAILTLDADQFCRVNPVSFLNAVKQIKRMLYGH